jgi:NhaA family Na+:H+ antiporter
MATSRLAQESVSPLARMQDRLHPWSAYAILPLFALANAGVPFTPGAIGDALTGPVGLGIVLGLVVGAPVFGFLFAWGIVASRAGRLPEGLDWAAIGAVTPLKGIGFTIAIFISALAFEESDLQEEAKLAILVASAVAAVVGLVSLYGRYLLQRRSAT